MDIRERELSISSYKNPNWDVILDGTGTMRDPEVF
jgi:hypothetical protein